MVQSAPVKSAMRVIEVLEHFKRTRQAHSLSSIVQELGYPQSSATVLLKTLAHAGYLNYDRRLRVYFPTAQVTALGDWIPATLFGPNKALDALRDLHAATLEGVTISTANDIYLQYVQTIQSQHALRYTVGEGSLRLLTHSGLGWTLLSTLPDEKIDNVVRRANIASEKDQRVTPAWLLKKVSEIRAKGYCWTEDIPILGSSTMCTLLPIDINKQPAVMSLGGAKERVFQNRERYFTALQNAVGLLESPSPAEPEKRQSHRAAAPADVRPMQVQGMHG